MSQGSITRQEQQTWESFANLGALLTAIMAVDDEQEIARLVATGLPAFLPCGVSGMALRHEATAQWGVVLQQGDQPSVSPALAVSPAELEALFTAATVQGILWLPDGAPLGADHPRLLWPARLGVPCLAVVPLLTLQHQVGMLLVGRERPADFSRHEAFLLNVLAECLAITITHCRLTQQYQQRVHELDRLVKTCTVELHMSQAQYRQTRAEMTALEAGLDQEGRCLQEESATDSNFAEIIGESPALRKMLRAVEVVAPTDTNVLLLGETGTGKELVARAIHAHSPRAPRPLVKVNCAALPAGLVESELFGHEKGAFTGALARKIGRFELADGGTIFLDEIGDMPLELQAKLLRVLQEGECERLGSTRTIKVDVRIIASTNRDLKQAMQEGGFRPDLYYRLHVFPIRLLPLRERQQDIALLVRYFVARYSAKLGKRLKTIPHETMQALQAYPWPGNIRELEHVIERAVLLSPGTQLELGEWLPTPTVAPNSTRIPTLAELQRDHIVAVLQLTGWRVSGEKGAARVLGLKATTLEARIKKLGIQRNGSRLAREHSSPTILGIPTSSDPPSHNPPKTA